MGNLTDLIGGIPPGTVDPFSQEALGQATGNAAQAMHNRYLGLGVGVPSGSPQHAAATHSNLSYAGPGTAEQMDLGTRPSLVGGIGGQAGAAFGQEQLNALGTSTPGTGKGGGGLLGK